MSLKTIAVGSITINDISDGVDSCSVSLSNDNYSIMCNEVGEPKIGEIGTSVSRAKAKIIVKKGNTELIPIGENEVLTEGKFKYKLDNVSSSLTCQGDRIDNEQFYLKEIYTDSGSLEVNIFVESETNQFYKSFTWNKTLDGEMSRYINLIGPRQFYYDNAADLIPTPTSIELETLITNIASYTLVWQYKTSEAGTWTNVTNLAGSVLSGNKLTINDKQLFNSNKVTYIKSIVTDLETTKVYSAIHDIVKVYGGNDGGDGANGSDGYTITLTNESHTILCDKNGTPKSGEINSTTCNAKSSIIVKKGKTTLTSVGDTATPGIGQWKYKFEPVPTNCSATRITNESFYLSTVTANSGVVDLTIYLEGVTETDKIIKQFTWNKVIEGSNAPYIKLNGEQFFKYDNKSDTTPTPSSIILSVDSYNITSPTYVWQYYNSSWVTITSQTGSLISGSTLTINDKLLFGTNDSVRIRCYTNNLGNTIYDSMTITKAFDGEIGIPGDDSKTVKITGIDKIKYTNGTPNTTSIVLTATPTNYVTQKYKWYKLVSGNFVETTVGVVGNKITLQHGDLLDTNIIKVECSETNDSDKSFDEFQIVKIYDGTDGDSYSINIINGTRNLCYNGKNSFLPTTITPFGLEVYKNNVNVVGTASITSITWGTKGHYTNPASINTSTFSPIALLTYDETKLDTQVSITVNCEGRILKASVPITVSKNSTALDWIEEWEGSKVDVGGNYIISPKIFAGKKNVSTNKLTGVAIGQDIVNLNSNVGIAIYNENNLIGQILSTPTAEGKIVIFGSEAGKQFSVKADGSVLIEGGSGKSVFDLSNGTFRLGTSDLDFKLKFDGTNLIMGDGAITWANLDAQSKLNMKTCKLALELPDGNTFKGNIGSPKKINVVLRSGETDVTSSAIIKWYFNGVENIAMQNLKSFDVYPADVPSNLIIRVVATYNGVQYQDSVTFSDLDDVYQVTISGQDKIKNSTGNITLTAVVFRGSTQIFNGFRCRWTDLSTSTVIYEGINTTGTLTERGVTITLTSGQITDQLDLLCELSVDTVEQTLDTTEEQYTPSYDSKSYATAMSIALS